MSMGGHLAPERVRGAHDLRKLVIGHLLRKPGGGVRENTTGGGNLDHVGAVLDGGAHRPATVIGSVADGRRRHHLKNLATIAVDIGVPPGA